mgnify:CR=1 FL=1
MTTIVSVRRNGQVVIGGDGQVSLGNTVMKGNARKVHRLYNGKVLAGFAGGTADAFTLLERFEAKLQAHQGNLERAAVALADAYGIARRNYYYSLADSRPASRKYARRKDGGKGGWITRAEEFISPKFHLTEAQHRARVANWP